MCVRRTQKIRRALKVKKLLRKTLTAAPSGGSSQGSGGGSRKQPGERQQQQQVKSQSGRTVELHVTEGSRLGSQLVYPADDTGLYDNKLIMIYTLRDPHRESGALVFQRSCDRIP